MRNQRGLSLPEILIISVIMGVLVLAMGYKIARQTTSSHVAAQGTCQARADALIEPYKVNALDLPPLSWHPISGQTLVPPPVAPFNTPNSFPIYTEQASHEISNDLINTWELIGGPANRALYLYNLPGYCTFNNPGKLIDGPPGAKLNQEKTFLNINRLDLKNEQSDCSTVGIQKLVATSPTNTSSPWAANKILGINKGLRVTATVQFVNNEGLSSSCQASAVVSNQDSQGLPQFVKPAADILNVYSDVVPTDSTATTFIANLGGSKLFAFVSNQIFPFFPLACDAGGIAVITAVNKAATVFLCSPLYYQRDQTSVISLQQQTPFKSCLDLSVTSASGFRIAGGITQIHHGEPTAQTGVVFTFPRVQEGFYAFFIKAIDDAQDSSEIRKITFGVDKSRPNKITVTPPSQGGTNLISTFGGGQLGAEPVAANQVRERVSFGSTLFQCDPGGNDFFWQAATSPTAITVAPEGAYWYFDQMPYDGNPYPARSKRCLKIVSTPTSPALQNQTAHVMRAEACDFCGGSGVTTNPVEWWVDLGPPPTLQSTYGYEVQSFGRSNEVERVSFSFSGAKRSPLRFTCENLNHTFSSASGRCVPQGYSNQPCTDKGSRGFCAQAFDGCGRSATSNVVRYRVLAELGQNCTGTACDTGLVCAVDHSTSRGSCVSRHGCRQDSDCGSPYGPEGNICFLSSAAAGLCHGVSVGPATLNDISSSIACPDLVEACQTAMPQATATCSPDCGCAGAVAYNATCADSCGTPGACAGTRSVAAVPVLPPGSAGATAGSSPAFNPTALAVPVAADINTPPLNSSMPATVTTLVAPPPATIAPVPVPTLSNSPIADTAFSAPSPVLPQASPNTQNAAPSNDHMGFKGIPTLH